MGHGVDYSVANKNFNHQFKKCFPFSPLSQFFLLERRIFKKNTSKFGIVLYTITFFTYKNLWLLYTLSSHLLWLCSLETGLDWLKRVVIPLFCQALISPQAANGDGFEGVENKSCPTNWHLALFDPVPNCDLSLSLSNYSRQTTITLLCSNGWMDRKQHHKNKDENRIECSHSALNIY